MPTSIKDIISYIFRDFEWNKADKHNTYFVVPFGTYEFEVLRFGLDAAPAIFQRTLDLVLAEIKFEFVLVYIDDLIVYSASLTDHLKHVDAVLSRLQFYGLSVGLTESKFVGSSVVYLGHIISADGFRPDTSHLDAIRKCPRLSSPREVKSVAALCSYYQQAGHPARASHRDPE